MMSSEVSKLRFLTQVLCSFLVLQIFFLNVYASPISEEDSSVSDHGPSNLRGFKLTLSRNKRHQQNPTRLKSLAFMQQYLNTHYAADKKLVSYVGSIEYLPRVTIGTPQYFNSIAVFPNQKPYAMHGELGIYPNRTRAWRPQPTPIPVTEDNRKELLKNGGFYLNLSNALPLDRDAIDARPSVCRKKDYNIKELGDVSVIITFYNEPFSTLMRSIHSVLNRTPPPLLREIILVDDHSNLTDPTFPGDLSDYLTLLPKVKMMRLPERRGLVVARLAGARAASAPTLVVLDSHIEVNNGWLEPQLDRLRENPKSIVFPQIPSIESDTFTHSVDRGIGCKISFKWAMQEKSEAVMMPESTDPIPSPSMAGGLFAVRADWFWELGGYDEQFSMWGAENVEMGFRTWMCGGRLECTPCAFAYHIYRQDGAGYSSPPEALWRNRLRTARVWTDEYFQFAQIFISAKINDMGSLDDMLELKERLKCKSFNWFLQEVDHVQPLRELTDLKLVGQIRNTGEKNMCIDTLTHSSAQKPFGAFHCHEGGGTQGFLWNGYDKLIHSFLDETVCLGSKMVLENCSKLAKDPNTHWILGSNGSIIWAATNQCLTLRQHKDADQRLYLAPCQKDALEQQWQYNSFVRDPNFHLPDFSDKYKREYKNVS